MVLGFPVSGPMSQLLRPFLRPRRCSEHGFGFSSTRICRKRLAFQVVSPTLELSFANRFLRQLCENEITAKRQLGDEASQIFRRRLADLRAVASVTDIVIGKLQFNEDSKPAEISMEICDGCRVIFCPNHNATPELATGNVDWKKVTRIKIMRIEK